MAISAPSCLSKAALSIMTQILFSDVPGMSLLGGEEEYKGGIEEGYSDWQTKIGEELDREPLAEHGNCASHRDTR